MVRAEYGKRRKCRRYLDYGCRIERDIALVVRINRVPVKRFDQEPLRIEVEPPTAQNIEVSRFRDRRYALGSDRSDHRGRWKRRSKLLRLDRPEEEQRQAHGREQVL